MGTTPRGINYPDGSDPVLPVTQLQQLAQDADAAIGAVLDPVRFAYRAEGANQGLTTSYVDHGTTGTTFTPPAGWASYRALFVAGATIGAASSGDLISTLVRIQHGAASLNGVIATDEQAASNRTLLAFDVQDGLSDAVTAFYRARNTTAARGTIYTSWLAIIATRQT